MSSPHYDCEPVQRIKLNKQKTRLGQRMLLQHSQKCKASNSSIC